MVKRCYPRYYGRQAPLRSWELAWEATRPADHLYWQRVGRLRRAGGFWCRAVLAELHAEPGQSPLLALQLTPAGWWPHLSLPGALAGTEAEGSPAHLSLCYLSEAAAEDLAAAQAKWGRPRRVWVSCTRVTSGATCQLGRGCPLSACPVLRRLHAGGWYRERPLHVSL